MHTIPSHDFLRSFSAITIHFYYYYQMKLPDCFKSANDAYNAQGYIWKRIQQEEELLKFNNYIPDLGGILESGSGDTVDSMSTDYLESQRGKRGIDGDGEYAAKKTKTGLLKERSLTNEMGLKFKNITGEPPKRKRCSVLKSLPRVI
ncbi:hypothetical protein ABW20_dc0101182 [Dactylellina cionopaga]|nr:hypothetical protein ABW20_dc0101182 [Dactylellina cionopaga]